MLKRAWQGVTYSRSQAWFTYIGQFAHHKAMPSPVPNQSKDNLAAPLLQCVLFLESEDSKLKLRALGAEYGVCVCVCACGECECECGPTSWQWYIVWLCMPENCALRFGFGVLRFGRNYNCKWKLFSMAIPRKILCPGLQFAINPNPNHNRNSKFTINPSSQLPAATATATPTETETKTEATTTTTTTSNQQPATGI